MGEQSPYQKEELLSRDVDSLVDLLSSFQEEPGWDNPTLRGLAKELTKAVKGRPEYFTPSLDKFVAAAGRLLSDKGSLLAMKGKMPEDELQMLPAGWRLRSAEKLAIPGLEGERHLLILGQA